MTGKEKCELLKAMRKEIALVTARNAMQKQDIWIPNLIALQKKEKKLKYQV